MWTYKTPYTADEKTRPYIEKRGRLALSRALNIGRVVGFVASGATTAYGQISWGDLVKTVVNLALDLSNRPDVKQTGALRAARETMERFEEDGQLSRNATHVMGLASTLADLAGKKQIFREEAAKLFCETRLSATSELLEEFSFDQRANPIRSLVSDLRLCRFLTLNYDVEIEEEFRRLYRTSGTSRSEVLPTAHFSSDQSATHSMGADETEQAASAHKSVPRHMTVLDREKPETAFDVLCGGSNMYHRALNLPRRVEYADGTSRSVLSVSMSAENISDLVNFALHPRQYVGQVLHLHGRYDKPEDMVMTDEDYRLKYMRTDENALCFEEAQSALHTGNDILFVGSGMREADILQPLRQFISTDKSPDFAQRHVFAMLENKVTLDRNWFENERQSPLERLKQEFTNQHLIHAEHEAPSKTGASRSDYNNDEQEALRLRSEFGVFALFHGGQELRILRFALELLKLAKPKTVKLRSDDEESPTRLIGVATTNEGATALSAAMQSVVDALCGIPVGEAALVSAAERDALLTRLRAVNNALKPDERDENGLLNKSDLAQLKSLLEPDKRENDRIKAVETEIRSRALAAAISDLEERRAEWWREWREHPKERNAKFRPTYLNHDTNRLVPTHARHRPVYEALRPETFGGHGGQTAFETFQILRYLRETACEEASNVEQACAYLNPTKKEKPASPYGKARREPMDEIRGGHLKESNSNDLSYFALNENGRQRNFRTVPPRRIVRCCMPRGFGKGSLLHLLQQADHTGKSLILDGLFDPTPYTDSSGKPWRYHGAFCLHLSFSMEFASVISALKEFVEDALVGILTDHPEDVLKSASRVKQAPESHSDTFLNFLWSEFDPRSNEEGSLGKTLSDLVKGSIISPQDAKTKIEIRLTDKFWRDKNLARGRGRMHRLEDLRLRLSAYTDIVDVLKTKNLRLFVAISGPDKLCDEKGNAFNPMFRALFRLLTGCGAKYASESDVTMPIDFLFVSGTRGAPIRYLTPEVDETQVEEAVLSPRKGAPPDFIAPLQTTTPTGRKKYLRDWPVAPVLSFSERYWIKNSGSGYFWRLLSDAEDQTREDDLTREIRSNSLNIRRSLNTGVALSSWCAGAIAARLEGTRRELSDDAKRQEVVRLIKLLDGATARGGTSQILREIMEVHKEELRAWCGLLVEDKELRHPSPLPANWPERSIVQNERYRFSVSRAETDEGNKLVELAYVVLAHLSLFPMPVEARVLYGCDEIHDLLRQICAPNASTSQVSKEKDVNEQAKRRDIERRRRLRVLSQLLEYLHRAALIIAVQGKTHGIDNAAAAEIDLGGGSLSRDDVHIRFTVQHQLRDFGARLMDLSVPDQGERNFFQTSIYCDQPRDLPSPNEDHYRLVRDIMERQIIQSRNTIWCLTQLTRLTDVNKRHHRRPYDQLTENDRKLARDGLKRRLFSLTDDSFSGGQLNYSTHFESLHAVPQRVRAIYGLLRSGFSIGTISRLPGLDETFPDQPYERFRGWLRGVTNAAIGWDKVLDQLFSSTSPIKPAAFDRAIGEAVGNKPKTGQMPTHAVGLARPLYRDEIGWLLNERGLVALVTGNIFDAIPLFQRAIDEMHHDDTEGYYDPSLHAAVRRVRLNQNIALIERGHLDRAASGLNELQLPSGFSDHSGSQVSWLAKGYLGLVQHLTGNHAGARLAYEEVIERSRERSMMRSVAIFSKHMADLERRSENYPEARRYIQNAIDASLQCAQRDIFQLAMISKASLDLTERGLTDIDVGRTISEAIKFSHSMGIPRIEVEALRLQSNSLLIQGDRMQVGKCASRAAAIANRNGLRLQKLSALVSYGRAIRKRGLEEQGASILEETKREAERRGYQSLARDILT